jgi:tetratricopeptide (TPR) repeat protein
LKKQEKIMTKKDSKNAPTVAKRTAIIIAGIMFVLGFFAGAGFQFFKTNPTPDVASNSNTGVDYATREKTLETEVLNHPENMKAWIQLGHVYFDTEKHEKAINAYEKALKMNPNNANVLTDLGIMYRRTGQFRKAVENFDKAIAVDPKHENARLNKGIVLMHDLNDREGAIRAWEDLLEINPFAMVGKNQSLDQMLKHFKESHDKNPAN